MGQTSRSFLSLTLFLFSTASIGAAAANSPSSDKLTQAAPASATVKAIVLKQKHCFLGENLVTISDGAVRMQNLGRLGFILIAKKPKWNVTIYRADDKTYYTESLQDFVDTGLFSNMMGSRHERLVEGAPRITDSKICALSCKRATSDKRMVEYLPLGKIAPQVETVLFGAYKASTNGGIPLYFSKQMSGKDWLTGIKDKNTHREYLCTDQINTARLSPDEFELPSGYKPVLAAQEVICSKANRDGAADLKDIFAINDTAKHK